MFNKEYMIKQEGAILKSNNLIYPIGIVMLTLLLLYVLYKIIFIKRIHVSIPSLIYASNADNYCIHNQETMVHIKGERHSQLIGESYFTGTIWVDNYKPCMAEPTQVRFPLEENNMFFYSFNAQPGDHYCYVYLDDNGEEVALLFPGGIHVVGPASNKVEIEKVLRKSWGYQKIEYETHSLVDFIYTDQKFCFGSLKLYQTNKISTMNQNKDSILKSTTETVNRCELRYQRYLYFNDVKIAVDNVLYIFQGDILIEISILLSYPCDDSYNQAVSGLKEALAAFSMITICVCSNNTYYKDQTGKQLILQENPSNQTVKIRIN
jgi:hypothetical protein